MTPNQYFKNLTPPTDTVDVILDTDAYNEIDDQFAIAYMLRSSEKMSVKGICAAPFHNARSESPEDGMEKSYDEILKLLKLAKREDLKGNVYRGSRNYLADETTPAPSEAADFMAKLAENYSPERPLYVIAIGAITNVASAILKNPAMKENCVIVWLGGNAIHMPSGAAEFNMMQDIAAARVIFGCGVPFIQLPCSGVVDQFRTSGPELKEWFKGKNALCDYLYENTCDYMDRYAAGRPWSKVLWDVTAVAWIMNTDEKFMFEKYLPSPIPEYDKHYAQDDRRHPIKYVYAIRRDALFIDLMEKLTK